VNKKEKEVEKEQDIADKRNDDWWRLEKSQIGRRKFC
jgi:hypothetical protein